ncbi:MAG: non-homologous end-joining DNA ligase [Saprospiraceae bacterium]|nr:non-homologous end-joining DNA ligase [Saprospiraceae bacterium]
MRFGPYTFDTSNLNKVIFPEIDLTKGDLIDYYVSISNYMLPHTISRPLAMHRFPDGINGDNFFQKSVPDYFPDWIKTTEIEREEGSLKMLSANNKATLAYIANQACITPHVFLSTTKNIDKPDKMVFDLDPPENGFNLVVKAAKLLRTVLTEERGLNAYVMTTGSRGMHVVVPLRPELDYDKVRDYAREVCEELGERNSQEFTTEVRKSKRKGRLFLDYLRNSYGQHSVTPYALRAISGAPVATPVEWDELEDLPNGSQSYNFKNIFKRLGQTGDPWKDIKRHAVSL